MLYLTGGCLLTKEVGLGPCRVSTDSRGKSDVPGVCLLTEVVYWRYLVGVY